MKKVGITGAGPTPGVVVEPVEIAISGHWPESTTEELNQLGGRFEADARMLFDALRKSLPGGTLDRLLSLMLAEKASHFIIADWAPKVSNAELRARHAIAKVGGESNPNEYRRPVDMLLYCPSCGLQHIDESKPDICETCGNPGPECVCSTFTAWLNPPHKSHRCNFCNHVWRPADVPTNGVAALQTKGERDSDPVPRVVLNDLHVLLEELESECGAPYADDGYTNGLDFAIQKMRELAKLNPKGTTNDNSGVQPNRSDFTGA